MWAGFKQLSVDKGIGEWRNNRGDSQHGRPAQYVPILRHDFRCASVFAFSYFLHTSADHRSTQCRHGESRLVRDNHRPSRQSPSPCWVGSPTTTKTVQQGGENYAKTHPAHPWIRRLTDNHANPTPTYRWSRRHRYSNATVSNDTVDAESSGSQDRNDEGAAGGVDPTSA
jgi:hypothetical protein